MKSSPSPADPSFRLRRGNVSDLDSEVEDMVERIDGQDPEMREAIESWDDEEDFGSEGSSRWKWVAILVVAALLVGVAALAASGQDPIALIQSILPANAPEF